MGKILFHHIGSCLNDIVNEHPMSSDLNSADLPLTQEMISTIQKIDYAVESIVSTHQ